MRRRTDGKRRGRAFFLYSPVGRVRRFVTARAFLSTRRRDNVPGRRAAAFDKRVGDIRRARGH